jgi:uncharacterized repeat protein (TIGR03803 family)
MVRLSTGTLAACLLFCGTAAAQNLIRDPSFESPKTPRNGLKTYSAGQKIGQWSVFGGGNVATVGTDYQEYGYTFNAQSGNASVNLNGTCACGGQPGVAQTVTTIPGATYQLTFWVGNASMGQFGSSSTVNVYNGATLLISATNNGNNDPFEYWQQFQVNFTASSASTVLSFVSEDPSGDVLDGLDNVSLVETGPSFSTLFTFTGSNGSEPNGGPLLYNGVLYGSTVGGGAKNKGTVWGYTLSSNSLQTLYEFKGSDGSQPRGSLSVYNNTLYGSTLYGGAANDGLIYSLYIPSDDFSPIYSFTGASGGSAPGAGLIVYNGNTIFGAAVKGGAYNFGDIFQVSLQNDQETTLYSFPGGSKGNTPDGVLTLGPSNVIYGATVKGGTANDGLLFSIPAGGVNTTVLYRFPGEPGGQTPNGGLVFDTAGNIYGTTRVGGTGGEGTIFKFVPGTGALTILYDFRGDPDGGHPDGQLLIDSHGNLYGAATQFGYGYGTIFEYNASSQSLTTLYTFTGGSDGESPNGGLAVDSSGALYGTTSAGGTNGYGTLFKLVP